MSSLRALVLEKVLKNMSANEVRRFIETNTLPNRFGSLKINVFRNLNSNRTNILTPMSRSIIRRHINKNLRLNNLTPAARSTVQKHIKHINSGRQAASVANWKRFENQQRRNMERTMNAFLAVLPRPYLLQTPRQLNSQTKSQLNRLGRELIQYGIFLPYQENGMRDYLNYIRSNINHYLPFPNWVRRRITNTLWSFDYAKTRNKLGNRGRSLSRSRAARGFPNEPN